MLVHYLNAGQPKQRQLSGSLGGMSQHGASRFSGATVSTCEKYGLHVLPRQMPGQICFPAVVHALARLRWLILVPATWRCSRIPWRWCTGEFFQAINFG